MFNILEHEDHTSYVARLESKGARVEVTVVENEVHYKVYDEEGCWTNCWVYDPADYPESED